MATYLAEGGAVVAGTAALVAATAYIGAVLLRDAGAAVDPAAAAERGAQLGAVVGLAVWILNLLGVD